MKWINVKDRLPEEGKEVLTYSKKTKKFLVDYIIEFKNLNPPSYIWACRKEYEYLDITHWMPLSEPPKESE